MATLADRASLATFADRAPLTRTQSDALRRLEVWATRHEACGDDEGDTASAAVAAFTLGPCGLIPHGEPPPAAALAPIRTAGDLEEFSLRAEATMRERRHAPEHAHMGRLRAQHECSTALAQQAAELREQLESRAAQCADLRGETSQLLSALTADMVAAREQAALRAALREQLAPLEEARAVGAVLDQHAWRDDTPHQASHPLVRALAQLDASAADLTAHSHWANSAVHLAQVHAMRVRALGLVAGLVVQPLEALTGAVAAKLAQAAPAGGGGAQKGAEVSSVANGAGTGGGAASASVASGSATGGGRGEGQGQGQGQG